MRDAPDRDEIDAGLGEETDGFERHSAGRLEGNAAGDELYRLAQLGQVHIVEEQPIGAGRKRRLDLVDTVDLDLDLKPGVGGLGASDRFRDVTADRNMIVLDQHSVIEAHPVVLRAAHPGRIFFQRAEAGNRLSSIEQDGAGTLHGVDVAPRLGRNAGQMLQRVQRRPLGGQHGARVSVQPHQGGARLRPLTVCNENFDDHGVVTPSKEGCGNVDAGDKRATVHLAFKAPKSPEDVRAYFVDQFKAKGIAATTAGTAVSGKTKDGDPFVIEVEPAEQGSQGTITIQDDDRAG